MTQTAGTETEIGDDSDAPAIAGLWAVIPAGGAGTRLWPLSRSSSPKFLHDMTGAGNSLLQATWDRLRPLCGDHIMVVAGVMHEAAVRVQLPGLAPARLAAGLRDIAAEPARLEELWPGLTSVAIDHAVAEPAAAVGRVAVVPGRFTWDDVGDFASLGSLLPEVAGVPGLKVLGEVDLVLAKDATGVVIPGSGRTVAVLGLDDIVVVDTPDALLITTRARAQEVKTLTHLLKASGRADLT